MWATPALVVRLVGRIEISLADLHNPGCPPLTEVELFCCEHGNGWVVHVWPVTPPRYERYLPTNEQQADLVDLWGAVTP